jgi:hypothetical protein
VKQLVALHDTGFGLGGLLFFCLVISQSLVISCRVCNKKNPTKKTHPKTQKKPPKNLLKWVFWFIFLFLIKIIQTFLFETDFE